MNINTSNLHETNTRDDQTRRLDETVPSIGFHDPAFNIRIINRWRGEQRGHAVLRMELYYDIFCNIIDLSIHSCCHLAPPVGSIGMDLVNVN